MGVAVFKLARTELFTDNDSIEKGFLPVIQLMSRTFQHISKMTPEQGLHSEALKQLQEDCALVLDVSQQILTDVQMKRNNSIAVHGV